MTTWMISGISVALIIYGKSAVYEIELILR